MKVATPGLAAWLATAKTLAQADLYTFTLQSGTILRYTSADRPIMFGANTWLADGPVLKRGRTKITIGVDVSTLQVTIAPRPGQTLLGLSWMEAIRRGALDGATLLLERAYAADWGSAVVGTEIRFMGRVAGTRGARAGVELEIRSPLDLLNSPIPGEVYQPQCRNALFGPRCTLDRALWEVSKAVASGSTTSVVRFTDTAAAGYFTLGKIVGLTGVNVGAQRSIKLHTSGQVELVRPLHALPAVGDLFVFSPGCDRRFATCGTKFSNAANFRGDPFVPPPEALQ